jgi:hypothetical protein
VHEDKGQLAEDLKKLGLDKPPQEPKATPVLEDVTFQELTAAVRNMKIVWGKKYRVKLAGYKKAIQRDVDLKLMTPEQSAAAMIADLKANYQGASGHHHQAILAAAAELIQERGVVTGAN